MEETDAGNLGARGEQAGAEACTGGEAVANTQLWKKVYSAGGRPLQALEQQVGGGVG